MTYPEWLDTLISPINSFISWLSMGANSLIHNYFVITLLGIGLFISLVWLVFNLIFDSIDHINKRYDDYNDKYYNLELSKEARDDYLKNHRDKEFDYLYDHTILKQQVLNGIYQNHRDLLIDNKVQNLQVYLDSLKKLKQQHLEDNIDTNDNDVDMIIPNPPVQLANTKELHKNLIDENPNLHNELFNENNSEIDRIISENKNLLNKNVSSNKSTILLGMFAYYDKNSKSMKKIALPVDSSDTKDFQFDNDNLSDIDRDFINSHTLIRLK